MGADVKTESQGNGQVSSKPRARGVQRPSPPRRASVADEVQPATAAALRAQVDYEAGKLWERRKRHDVLASRWDFVAGWARLIVALGASLSTLSVISSNDVAAVVFSLATAVVSALNAAFNPPDTSRAHRTAALDFGHCLRQLAEILYAIDSRTTMVPVPDVGHTSDGRSYDATGYEPVVDAGVLGDLWSRYCSVREKVEAAEKSAPPINRLRMERESSLSQPIPETFWALRRYKRALKYVKKAWESYDECFAQSFTPSRQPVGDGPARDADRVGPDPDGPELAVGT